MRDNRNIASLAPSEHQNRNIASVAPSEHQNRNIASLAPSEHQNRNIASLAPLNYRSVCRSQCYGWMLFQISGAEPSTSVNPYSCANWPLVTDCWFHRLRFGSAARLATARPTYRGDSDIAKSCGATGWPRSALLGSRASRQLSSDTPWVSRCN